MASRQTTEPVPKDTAHRASVDIDKAIKKLRATIEQTRKLQNQEIAFDDPKVDSTQKNIRDSIRDIFGSDSTEYYDHSQHKIWHGGQIYLESRSQRQQKFIAGIPHTVSMLEGLISRLEDRRKAPKVKPTAPQPDKTAKKSVSTTAVKNPAKEIPELPQRVVTNRVCVIHGQNDALMKAVNEYLEKLGLEPVVLHKQQTSNRNIMEKIESLPEVDFAVVLLTPDDFAQPGKPMRNGKGHSKRNVLFELGYYIGRLGKSRVCALYNGQDKPPRDYDGISCLSISDNQVWRRLLELELKGAGFALATPTGE